MTPNCVVESAFSYFQIKLDPLLVEVFNSDLVFSYIDRLADALLNVVAMKERLFLDSVPCLFSQTEESIYRSEHHN